MMRYVRAAICIGVLIGWATVAQLAHAQAGGNVNNAVGVWGQDSGTGLPCIVAPAGGSATCVLPTTSGGGGGGGTSSNFGSAFPAAGTAAGFKNSAGTNMAPGNLDNSGNLLVNVAAGGAGGGAVYGPTAVGSAAANPPVIVGGTVGHTATGNVQVIDVNTSGQAAIQAPPTLPLPTGAATAANQTTGNGSLSTIATNTTNAATTTNQSSQITQETAINTVLGTVTASPTANTLADRLKTINTTLGSPFQAAGSIGNTAFGISGTLPAFAATPTFNCGTGCFQATQPVSGTVTANAGTNLNTSALALETGGNLATLTNRATGTSSGVVAQGAGTAGSAAGGVLTVQGSASGTAIPVTASGTGNFTVVQPTASALNVTVVGTGTLAVQAAQSGAWNITNVSGTVSLPTGASTEATLAKLAVAQASTTSGQSGTLTLGAVTTSAPTYTTAQSSPLSLTTAGALRTDASATTQPVSGTVTANAGTGTFNIQSNASTNTAQVNGVTTLTGTGATGTGSQRVTVAQDTNTVAGSASIPAGTNLMGKVGFDQTTPGTTNGVQDASTGSTGSAAPSKASYVGANSSGNLTGLVQADTTAAINVSTATTTQLVALSSGKKIYVTHWDVIAAAADNVTLEYGTGSACGTGTTVLTGAYNLAANGGISAGGGLGPVLVVPASNALCIVTSAAAQASGVVSYTQF